MPLLDEILTKSYVFNYRIVHLALSRYMKGDFTATTLKEKGKNHHVVLKLNDLVFPLKIHKKLLFFFINLEILAMKLWKTYLR